MVVHGAQADSGPAAEESAGILAVMTAHRNHHTDGQRHRRPVTFEPRAFEPFEGGPDPARVSEAAHLSAHALVRGGRDSEDPEVQDRLLHLTEREGLEAVAELWSDCPAVSLPGALWRLYALRSAILSDPHRASALFRDGRHAAPVARLVAGAAEPPGAQQMLEMADSVLSGAFRGDFDMALERAAAFCRVISLGQTQHAEALEVSKPEPAAALLQRAQKLLSTAEDLEQAAAAWRHGTLD